MWNLFTERARKAIFYSQEEAGLLGENFVSTEHMLLGLIREPDTEAAWILNQFGVSLDVVRAATAALLARGSGRLGQDMQLTPRAKRVVDLAYDEARQLNNSYIGTEHLLLGLIRDGEGIAGQVLLRLGVDLDRARQATVVLQTGVDANAWPPAPQVGPPQGPWYQGGQVAPPTAPPTPGATARRPSKLEQMKARGGILGGIASFLLLIVKAGGPIFLVLSKLKFIAVIGHLLLTGGTMFLSMFLWSYRFGWQMSVAFVLSIFFHECGHAAAARMRGIPFTAMVFIPFMGAAVIHKHSGKTVVEDAYIGIMGPVFGTIYGIGAVGLFLATHSPFWLSLASLVFLMNLFNLIPTAPLDGGWIVPVFSPKALAVGALLIIPIGFLNPLIWVLGVLSLPRIIAGWKQPVQRSAYFSATAADRWAYGIAYLGLIIFLGLAYAGSVGILTALKASGVF